MKISVIICTYNPNNYIFTKCLEALSVAVTPCSSVEILIINNNSDNGFEREQYFLNFLNNHNAKLILESNQGLTFARLRGIREAHGDLLVFIDDDNIVYSSFLNKVFDVSKKYPFIGSFSGQVLLIYDHEPPKWTKRYWGMLVFRKFSGNLWSNIPFDQDCMPCGAGLCVKREVAEHYYKLHKDGARQFKLDRSKNSLLSGGDNDLAMCACDLGMGMGLFEDLVVEHFIPSHRFTLKYLKELAFGIYFSDHILKYMRKNEYEKLSIKNILKKIIRTLFMKPYDGILNRSCLKGVILAEKQIRNYT